jgi:succinylglutamic semialdehyde dehydrogenase
MSDRESPKAPAIADAEFMSMSPATGQAIWRGRAADPGDVDRAIATGRAAQPAWEARNVAERIAILEACRHELDTSSQDLANAISAETGKPRWEAEAEIASMASKIPITIEAWRARRQDDVNVAASAVTATRYRAHGVLAVLGPFNFPGHIPHGHIVPAILAGNTVVFKPSEKTPLVGERTVEIWHRAGLPPGVLSLVQGGRDTGVALTSHPGIDGILFTGSFEVGVALRQACATTPSKILALEMGGNNPLVVHDVADIDAAVTLTILSAFLSAGQRCTCARRLIVTDWPGRDAFIDQLVARAATLRVGAPDDAPQPFMGPVIDETTARRLLDVQTGLVSRGGVSLLRMAPQSDRLTLLSPGIIDVTRISERADTEWFGPLLQVIRVPDFDAAINEANRTEYGLVAGLLCDDASAYEIFRRRVRAGLVNWNTQTTGASSALPFGGVGKSGNHRPSGSFAIDYCSYPVASLESPTVTAPAKLPPGMD